MDNLPEPWMRGEIPGVSALVAPVLYSFQQAREELAKHTEGLTAAQIWARPQGLGSVGFHLRHIAGSATRLMAYAQGRQLDDRELAELESEKLPSGPGREELLAEMDRAFRAAEVFVRSIDPHMLAERREVGRKRLPSTVIGLLTHAAEHTQRHVGQAICAARLARTG
jgi:uncharacterized damage-inducible protein DinB